MTLAEYIKDRILVLVLQISCMLLLFGFLNATGYPPDFCVLIGGGGPWLPARISAWIFGGEKDISLQ